MNCYSSCYQRKETHKIADKRCQTFIYETEMEGKAENFIHNNGKAAVLLKTTEWKTHAEIPKNNKQMQKKNNREVAAESETTKKV